MKKLASLRYQIMAVLNLNKALNKNLAINRHDQRIWFRDIIVLKISDIDREFAMNKGWRSCFLTEDELRIYYLLQNSSRFKLFKEIGKVLAIKEERFSGGNSANPSWIIVFDEATNLFTWKTPDLDTSRYITLNNILSCLKKLPKLFFMLSTEFKVEKLLPLDMPAKESEKDNKNRWNNPSGHIFSPSTYD